MLEIVFSESACGSLKVAQHFGQGNCGSTGVFLIGGEEATEEELRRAQRRAEEKYRQEWERARPIGGKAGDVYGFGLALDIGDISEDVPASIRRGVLCELVPFPLSTHGILEQIDRTMENAARGLEEVLRRSADGEPARLWYSGQPAELCGLFWMAAQLDGLKDRCGPLGMVQLPPWELRDDGVLVTRNGWGEVSPGEWYRFLPLERPMPPVLRRALAGRWRALQTENAPLRALLNGRLVSVPADFYDSFLRRELAKVFGEFQEAYLIGDVIGRYQLGVGDGFLASRIEAMLASGELEAVTQAPEDYPSYHRTLRKRPAP